MVFVIHFNNTPGVSPTANLTTIWGINNTIRSNNSEGNLAGNLLCLSYSLVILVLICRSLEDVNVVIGNVRKNLGHIKL